MKQHSIDPEKYGVSFSLKQCRNFDVDAKKCLAWLLKKGWRRFRLMSYWDEYEKKQGEYDFSELDWQLDHVAKAGGVISLCLGVKQPRWPEYHWPEWALKLSSEDRTVALLTYVEKVTQHVKDRPEIISYQLENEALLEGFGEKIQIDRRRLYTEYTLVKKLDPMRPIIMSTSNGWGVPVRRPIPDVVGFSLYTIMWQRGRYRKTIQKPWLHRMRAFYIKQILHRPVFIHELQCEPWGPNAIWEMSPAEQAKSINAKTIVANIAAAKKVGIYPIDLWGAEWWYWLTAEIENNTIAVTVKDALT